MSLGHQVCLFPPNCSQRRVATCGENHQVVFTAIDIEGERANAHLTNPCRKGFPKSERRLGIYRANTVSLQKSHINRII